MMVYVISQRPQVCGLTFAFNVSIKTCRFLSCRPTPDSVKECNCFLLVSFQPCTVWLPGFLSDSQICRHFLKDNRKSVLAYHFLFLTMQRYDEILQHANFSSKIFVFRCNFLCFVPFLLSYSLQNMYVCRVNVTKYVI